MNMQALQFDRTGSLDALQLRHVEVPRPAADEVLIKIEAAGINPSDVKNILGRFPYTSLPRIPGRDFAGTVIEGPAMWKGKSVWGSGKGVGFTRDGSHARYLTFPVAGLSLKPDTLSFVQAASVGVPYITALEAMERSAVKNGTNLLVIGAAGAVGHAAMAIAALRGARILAAVRKPQQQVTLQQQGINTVLIEENKRVTDSVGQYFPAGADVVFDTTGLQLSLAVSAVAIHGAVVVIAAPATGMDSFPLLDFYRKGGNLVGVNSLLHELPACAQMLDKLRILFDESGLKVSTALAEYALRDGLQAYRAVEKGCAEKCVLVMND